MYQYSGASCCKFIFGSFRSEEGTDDLDDSSEIDLSSEEIEIYLDREEEVWLEVSMPHPNNNKNEERCNENSVGDCSGG